MDGTGATQEDSVLNPERDHLVLWALPRNKLSHGPRQVESSFRLLVSIPAQTLSLLPGRDQSCVKSKGYQILRDGPLTALSSMEEVLLV